MKKITIDYVYSLVEESEDYKQHKTTINRYIEFITSRKSSANKILSQSERKSGPSRLTAIHFRAKVKVYEDVLKILKKGDDLQILRKKYTSTISKLRKNIRQPDQFQKLTGELEAIGEVLIYTKNM